MQFSGYFQVDWFSRSRDTATFENQHIVRKKDN